MWLTVTSGSPEGTTPVDGKRKNPRLMDTVQAWHSPCVADSDGKPRYDKRAAPGHVRNKPVPNITAQANDLWKTPTANEDAAGRPGARMQQQIKQQSEEWAHGLLVLKETGLEFQRDSGPLRLNPEFVEWLMGWPVGWTDFEPVATEWCRWRQRMLSELSQLHWQDA
jgi:hypothetical protein